MNSITSFSEKISDTLKNSRNQISKLSSVHELLERLQFLFKLPNKLKSHVQDEEYVKVCITHCLYLSSSIYLNEWSDYSQTNFLAMCHKIWSRKILMFQTLSLPIINLISRSFFFFCYFRLQKIIFMLRKFCSNMDICHHLKGLKMIVN